MVLVEAQHQYLCYICRDPNLCCAVFRSGDGLYTRKDAAADSIRAAAFVVVRDGAIGRNDGLTAAGFSAAGLGGRQQFSRHQSFGAIGIVLRSQAPPTNPCARSSFPFLLRKLFRSPQQSRNRLPVRNCLSGIKTVFASVLVTLFGPRRHSAVHVAPAVCHCWRLARLPAGFRFCSAPWGSEHVQEHEVVPRF
jgi:hypothetical protein